jgi:hypothetical protein
MDLKTDSMTGGQQEMSIAMENSSEGGSKLLFGFFAARVWLSAKC